jgi:anti-sigma regulatory factor (Ser/Thr protein kinase)
MEASEPQDRGVPQVMLHRLRSNEDAPRAARELIEEMLVHVEGHAPERRDDLILCVSELVANAVVHGAPGYLTVQIETLGSGVRVEVGDDGVNPFSWPERLNSYGHWGLNLVKRMSDRAGIDRRPWTVAWCEFDLAQQSRSG